MTHRHNESATKILMTHLLLWTKNMKYSKHVSIWNFLKSDSRKTNHHKCTYKIDKLKKKRKKNFEKNVKIDQPPEKKRIFRSAAMSGRYWQTRPSQANQHNRRNSPRKIEFWSKNSKKIVQIEKFKLRLVLTTAECIQISILNYETSRDRSVRLAKVRTLHKELF